MHHDGSLGAGSANHVTVMVDKRYSWGHALLEACTVEPPHGWRDSAIIGLREDHAQGSVVPMISSETRLSGVTQSVMWAESIKARDANSDLDEDGSLSLYGNGVGPGCHDWWILFFSSSYRVALDELHVHCGHEVQFFLCWLALTSVSWRRLAIKSFDGQGNDVQNHHHKYEIMKIKQRYS
eukprot:SAG31_NODE_3311_length_4434_cov_79.588005_4_plen_181_part_00